MRTILIIFVTLLCFSSCKKNDNSSKSMQPKTVFYRIKMIDKNGNVSYSQVRSVEEK